MSFDADDIDLLGTVRSILVPSTDVLLGTTAAALALVVGVTTTGLAQAVLGLLLVLFLQGYAVVAALFPATPERWAVRRLALPFGVSLAMLPPLGLGFSALAIPFTAATVLGTAAGITVVGLLVAGRRRVHLSRAQRGQSVLREYAGRTNRGLLDRPTVDLLVNALTLLAVLTAVSGLVFAVVAPAPTPQYTQFSVLTENESGETVAAGYPTNFTAGEGQNVVVEIANRGPEQQTYTVVVQLQQFDQSTGSVTARSRLRSLNQTVTAGETWNRSVTVTPDTTGRQMRLAFLLYTSEPPATPATDSADEHLFLWVNVSDETPGGPSTVTPESGTAADSDATVSTPVVVSSTATDTNETPTAATETTATATEAPSTATGETTAANETTLTATEEPSSANETQTPSGGAGPLTG